MAENHKSRTQLKKKTRNEHYFLSATSTIGSNYVVIELMKLQSQVDIEWRFFFYSPFSFPVWWDSWHFSTPRAIFTPLRCHVFFLRITLNWMVFFFSFDHSSIHFLFGPTYFSHINIYIYIPSFLLFLLLVYLALQRTSIILSFERIYDFSTK